MEIIVSGKHLEVTEAIRQYATDKAQRFPRYYDRVASVEAVIDKPDSRHFGVELIVHVDGHEHFVASGTNVDLYAAIDETSSKIERQLHDYKEKLRNKKHTA
jgi:putative sigma-54 modulation protein